MAIIYSLLCWGGRTGKTVSISATTDVVTLANHGLRTGAKLWPSGTLPAELNILTPVYARNTGSNTFTLHSSNAGASANTGQILFAGSSTYAAVVLKSDIVASPLTALTSYGLSDLSRWGASGSERIYDSWSSFVTARGSVTTGFDVEHCEVGEAMWDYVASGFTMSLTNAPLTKVTPTINDIYTPAKHSNVLDYGYTLYASSCGTGNNLEFNDLCFRPKDSGNNAYIVAVSGINVKIHRNCFYGWAKNGIGISMISGGVGASVQYNLCTNLATGINSDSGTQCIVANNTCVKNTNGFTAGGSTTNRFGKWFNNISLGNTTNWAAIPTTLEAASNNYGLATDTVWKVGSNPTITIATTDFSTWGGASYAATDNFKPASGASPQVDSATEFYGAQANDLTYAEVPSYNNGGSEARDGGCYEFDRGYGNHPATATISVTDIAPGSQVRITKSSDGTVLYNNAPGTSLSFSTSHIGGFDLLVRKASASPYYREFRASGTTVANQITSIKCLQQLDE